MVSHVDSMRGAWIDSVVLSRLPVDADCEVNFGTIEENPEFEDFRITAGVGLRLTVPAMGPAPIALDWAIPIRSLESDDERLFSFYIGLTR